MNISSGIYEQIINRLFLLKLDEVDVERFYIVKKPIALEYDCPNFHLIMHCYLCSIVSGQLSLLEYEVARWLAMDELDSVKWLPADVKVIKK